MVRETNWVKICAIFGMGLVALVSGASLLARDPLDFHFSAALLWLLLLAFLAEGLPVQILGRGVGITFTLPYVATIAYASSASNAMLVELTVQLLFALIYSITRVRSVNWTFVPLNAMIAILACSLGAIVMEAIRSQLFKTGWEFLGVMGFMAAAGLVSFVSVTAFDWLLTRRRISDNIVGTLQLGATSAALYVLVGLLAVVLLESHHPPVLLLTLVPVLALRAGLIYRARMVDNYFETITALTLMLKRAHPYTQGHVDRVALVAERVGRKLGLSRARARQLRTAAVLHDIGKIAVDESILDKPSSLSPEERKHVQQHALWGAEILRPVNIFNAMVPWIHHHHERPDGTGYPAGLSADEIPLESKIIAVVDAYDAMTGSGVPGAQRSYAKGMTRGEALMELERCSGSQFDHTVVAAFREVLSGAEA